MGFARKKASQLNGVRKSIHHEVGRAAKDPWKIAALAVAPWALPALGSMAVAGVQGVSGYLGAVKTTMGVNAAVPGGGGGFMSGLVGGAKDKMGSMLKSKFIDGAKNIMGGMSDKVKAKMNDPDYMSDMLLRAGSHLAGSKLAGDGLSDEERRLMEAMAGNIKTMDSQEQQLFMKEMGLADSAIQQAQQIDPEQRGLKAQRDVQIAAGVQAREADRDSQMIEGGRGLSAADKRRAGLEVTRHAQSAYLEGRETGEDAKFKATQAAAGLLPRGAPTAAFNARNTLLGQRTAGEQRRGDAAEQAGVFIEDTLRGGAPKSQGGSSESFGDKVKDKVKDTVTDALGF